MFGTSGGGTGEEVKAMEDMLNKKGANVKGKIFCKGKFFIMNRKKPDRKDLEEAKKFAKDMKNKVSE